LTNAGAIGLVSSERVWVDAFMKETDLTYAKPGNPVAISVDTYPGHTWTGIVESISPASASQFSILPAQNASGNWVRSSNVSRCASAWSASRMIPCCAQA
jgi:membrane fusion protein (multidrug efflux system)